MDEQTFMETATRRVSDIAATYGLTEGRAFLVWASGLLWGLTDEEAVEALMDGPNDKGVDLFWYDDVGDRVIVAQGKYSKYARKSPGVRALTAFPSCLNWLAKPQDLRRENLPDLADAAEEFVSLRERDIPVELWFVHFSSSDPNIEKEAEVFNHTKGNQTQRIQLRLASLERLKAEFEDLEDVEARVERDSMAVLWAQEQIGTYGPALVATIKGSELARLYEVHGNRLFARNVRLYLGERQGSVNRGIADTLEDQEDRGNFWAYNNGVTIVCHRFEYDPHARIAQLINFSIVNGCQTTVCLQRAQDVLAQDVEVLVKVVNPDKSVIDRIIEFTNSQNQIRTWDIKSQDSLQRRLKADLSALPEPFFYAIRKGEFEALDQREKARYRRNGQRRVIRFDSLAQYIAAFRGKAYYAYKFKSRLFEDLYRDIFADDLTAKEVVFVWQVGEMVRQVVRDAAAVATGKHDQQKLRILKKGARIYVLSTVDLLLRLRNGEAYLHRVADGRVLGANRREKVRKYCDWALDLYKEAVEGLLEDGTQDLNTLVRQSDFTDRVNVHAEREFNRYRRNPEFFQGAFPELARATRARVKHRRT